MQQMAEWLEKLGLGQYAPRFAENDIDPTVLRDLTDHDLEKIGEGRTARNAEPVIRRSGQLTRVEALSNAGV